MNPNPSETAATRRERCDRSVADRSVADRSVTSANTPGIWGTRRSPVVSIVVTALPLQLGPNDFHPPGRDPFRARASRHTALPAARRKSGSHLWLGNSLELAILGNIARKRQCLPESAYACRFPIGRPQQQQMDQRQTWREGGSVPQAFGSNSGTTGGGLHDSRPDRGAQQRRAGVQGRPAGQIDHGRVRHRGRSRVVVSINPTVDIEPSAAHPERAEPFLRTRPQPCGVLVRGCRRQHENLGSPTLRQ